jgi:hypothetical protein
MEKFLFFCSFNNKKNCIYISSFCSSFFFAIATNKRQEDISLDDHYYYQTHNQKTHLGTNNQKQKTPNQI